MLRLTVHNPANHPCLYYEKGKTWILHCGCGEWLLTGSCWYPPSWSWDTGVFGSRVEWCWWQLPVQKDIKKSVHDNTLCHYDPQIIMMLWWPHLWRTPLLAEGHLRRGFHEWPWQRSCRRLFLLEFRLLLENCRHRQWCHPKTKQKRIRSFLFAIFRRT